MVIEYTVIEYTVNLIVRPSKIQEIRNFGITVEHTLGKLMDKWRYLV